MVKDYIERLILEEEEEIEKLQTQMKKSLAELQSSQEWLENLQREKNIDYNIFSPRKFDAEADEKIEKAKAAVREQDQNVEYIRRQIESHVKRNQEYLKMREEDAGINSEIDTVIETDKEVTEAIDETGSENEILGNSLKTVTDIVDTTIDTAADAATDATADTLTDTERKAGLNTVPGIMSEKRKSNVSDAAEDILVNEIANSFGNNPVSNAAIDETTNDAVNEKTASIEETELIAFLKSIYKKTEVSLALLNGDRNKCKNEMKSIMHEIKKYVSELEKNEKM